MIVLQGLHKLLIGPIELLMEVLFSMETRIISNPVINIAVLSLIISGFAEVLFHWADTVHFCKLRKGKKTESRFELFHVAESFIFSNIQLSLVLEVLFFTAAYSFFNTLIMLKGVSWRIIPDLKQPYTLISLCGININILPILAILIRIITARILLKNSKRQYKIQFWIVTIILYGLLYSASSGFVLYWIVYEMLSLVKQILFQNENAVKVLSIGLSVLGLLLLVVVMFFFHLDSPRKKVVIIAAILLLQIPMIVFIYKRKRSSHLFTDITPIKHFLFIISSIYLTILTGMQIPSAVIQSSPTDFINISTYYSPLRYIFNTLILAMGTFIIWPGITYNIAPVSIKRIISLGLGIISVCGTVNAMFFGTDRGIMSNQLIFDTLPVDTVQEYLWNIAILVIIAFVLFLVWKKKSFLFCLLLVALCFMKLTSSVMNIVGIEKTLASETNNIDSLEKNNIEIPLSKNGKNVIVFMLDRSIGFYIPFIMAEKPELQKQFDGFTFYPNTLSFASQTNEGAPALFGGYEYTPKEINGRTEVSLSEKHNEALLLMPVLFNNAGYETTIIDPPYADYQMLSNLHIYDSYPGIKPYRAEGLYSAIPTLQESEIQVRNRNFFCYSIYKISPLFIQPTLYTSGSYNKADFLQSMDDLRSAVGIRYNFEQSYSVLLNLSQFTQIYDEEIDTFFTIDNRLTHEPVLLQLPDYTPSEIVDNSEYETLPIIRESIDGRKIELKTVNQVTHYHANMAAFILLGKWMDYLKDNGVYDNCRIIIVSDHGVNQGFPDHIFGSKFYEDVLTYNPVLLVKDFNKKDFSVDDRFMTNADVPTIAMNGLLEHPVNPITGIPVTDDAKYNSEILTRHTVVWDIRKNNGNTFSPGDWFRLNSDDIFNLDSWEALGNY